MTIYIQYSDCGNHIRKWDREPFDGGVAYVEAPVWRGIESAPRDRTSILGGYFNQPWAESHREGRIVKCWWQPEFEAFVSSCREMQMHNGYTFEDGSTRRLHSPEIEDVTHWLPLPTAPRAEGGK